MEPAGHRVLWLGVCIEPESARWLGAGLPVIALGRTVDRGSPLQDWAFNGNTQQNAVKHINFQPVADLPQLQAVLAQAQGKPVMLDLYADWCVACKEFEKYTFSDDKVQRQLANTLLLQADVTANNAEHAALLKKFNVLGLPTILFLILRATRSLPHGSPGLWTLRNSCSIYKTPHGYKINSHRRHGEQISPPRRADLAVA